MEGSDGSPPSSLWMIHAAEFFPKPPMEKEDEQLTVPFQELAGESVKYLGRTDDGVLALSNYRLFLLKNSTYSETSVPLGLIESAQTRDLFHLIINCKDASTVKCSFETAEQCSEWQRRITLSVGVPETLESLFAFPFYSWKTDLQQQQQQQQLQQQQQQQQHHHHHQQQQQQQQGINNGQIEINNTINEWSGRLQHAGRFEDDFRKEVERLQFDLNGVWRISSANEEFKLCPSYPPLILVPCCISDDTLQNVANFRGSRRLPAVVWRHKQSGAVIARSSQPEVGWLGWRNSKDEQLLKALADACAFDRGEQSRRQNLCTSGESTPSSAEGSHEEVCMDEIRKILIVDARSYTSAVTNRARGGGCECIEYYPCAEIEFMNLGNIHAIRKSFHALRQLCASPPDVPNWLGLLERTMWLQHLSGLLAASMTVCHAIEKKGRPVLVHCSDGWDRTPQIVATAELCLDPYYRTVEGFRILVEREWLNFGHKFADRCGHGPGSDEVNERCPVFLQWLDIVHQIHRQFPCSFEFSMAYLIKLAQHSHSCLFGTFLCNSLKERIDNTVFERTFSVWPFLSGSIYRNPLYVPNKEKVLWPAHNVRDIVLWSEVYLGSLGNQNSSDCPPNTDNNQGSTSPMIKTRSYGDLMTVGGIQNGLTRRSSDPNMTVESHLIMPNNHSDNNSIMDASSDRDDVETPDIIANIIHDTTEKLQNLTNELNQSDEEIYKINNFDADNNDDVDVDDNDNDNDDDGNSQKEQEQKQQNYRQQQENNIKALPENDIKFEKLENNLMIVGKTTTTTTTKATESSKIIKTTACFNIIDNSSSLMRRNEILIENGNGNGNENENRDNNDDDNNSTVIIHNNINKNMIDRRKEFIDVVDGQENYDNNMIGINQDMLESVDLKDMNSIQTSSILNTSSESQNLWYGSINTSTDTLVPIESQQQQQQQQCDIDNYGNSDGSVNGGGCGSGNGSGEDSSNGDQEFPITVNSTIGISNRILSNSHNSSIVDENTNTLNTTQKRIISNILPEVHCNKTMNNVQNNTNITNKLNNLNSNLNNANTTVTVISTTIVPSSILTSTITTTSTSTITNITPISSSSSIAGMIGMDESILILPEHQKLEISSSGKCETITSSIYNNLSSSSASIMNTANNMPSFSSTSSHRRKRTSSTNSKNEQQYVRNISGSATNSRFSTPGVRSLPLTPPGSTLDRVPVAITCPDGLAHALSEQNIRLQQIVYEHKLREDALLRELHGMRMALLKKTCPHCNNQPLVNDEQANAMNNEGNRKLIEFYHSFSSSENIERNNFHGDDSMKSYGSSPELSNSILDNIENLSVCSWEAVEDRSGPSSGASSTQPPAGGGGGGVGNSSSVLWVPDHAVTRCTGCQTEFWLGRRKHHCRSCGQIFCADCSEYWAPLPDERLYTPVRLCGPCYQNVTAGVQQQQNRNINNSHSQHHATATSTITISTSKTGTTQSFTTQTLVMSTTTKTTTTAASSSTTAVASFLNPSITTTTTSSLFLNSQNNPLLTNSSSINVHHTAVTSSSNTAATSMEACKHAANPSRNDRGSFKATAASN